MNADLPTPQTPTDTLVAAVARFYFDPLGFVYFAFPWGEGALTDETGPDDWQADILTTLGERLKAGDIATEAEAVQIAVASGHGVGKSALVAWVVLWFMSTRPHPQVVVTANTEVQLRSKTWRELAKWHRISRVKDWFTWAATKFFLNAAPDTWCAWAIPWSESNAEAFAGTHDKHVLVLFDEASTIHDVIWEVSSGAMTTLDVIWEVSSGAMTTPGAVWLAFGNPTRNTGRFRECWRRFRHRWVTRQVDSRTAKKANKTQIHHWVADYGEDSDFVRVRVRGVFPRAGFAQFIADDDVYVATRREPEGYERSAILLGVDVARFGDSQSVILARQGPAILHTQRFRGLDTMQFAARVAEAINRFQPAACFVDGAGVGGGVYDRLRELGYRPISVNVGERARDDATYFNLRAEVWSKMREWLNAIGCLPADDRELAEDLIAPEYGYDAKNRLLLEKKDDMRRRGLPSPDSADALALTFAEPVRDRARSAGARPERANSHYSRLRR